MVDGGKEHRALGEGECQEARIPDEGGVAPRRGAALPPEPFLKID